MKDKRKRLFIKIMTCMLCVLISFAFIPDTAFAVDDQDGETASDISALTEAGEISVSPEETIGDEDTLLEGYMDSRIDEELGRTPASSGMRKSSSVKRRSRLNDTEKYIYDKLKAFIDSAASGSITVAHASFAMSDVLSPYYVDYGNYYSVTSASLGISSAVYIKKTVDGQTIWTFSDEAKAKLYDFEKIINALMADEPYSLYWYDKTVGISYGISGLLINMSGDTSDIFFAKSNTPTMEVYFTVSEDYRASGGDAYSIDKSRTGAATAAVQNAIDIITDKSAGSDYERLIDYKDSICELTSYDREAAEDESTPYGDPWQIIYVFDGDPLTNVVCEGYAKAFQYLCDHTDFDKGIECDSVTGRMTYGQQSELHMWNILRMEDGRNYLADITNSDTGTVGVNGGLFISPAREGGTVDAGYEYVIGTGGTSYIKYTYDSDTRGAFADSELTMSTTAYDAPHMIRDAVYTWAEDGSSCTARGTCDGEQISEEAVVTGVVTKPATCTEDGITTYTATFNDRGFRTQRKAIADIPSLGGHVWNGGAQTIAPTENSAGTRTYTCTRCGATRNESIAAIVYPTDLPAVKISKPKAGKKKMTVKWKKVSKKNQKKIQGIEIQVATDPGFTNIIRTAYAGKKKTSKSITGLQSKAKYYVRIRAYNDAGGRHVSVWKSKSVKVK